MNNEELEFKVNTLSAQLKVQDERIDLLYQRLNFFESQVRGAICLTPSPFEAALMNPQFKAKK